MDVHHPHHPTHKKLPKEYLLEFLMLFLAVSMGFAAENIREEIVERRREVGYLQGVHHDLQNDVRDIDSTTAFIDVKQTLSDSLFAAIQSQRIAHDLPGLYYYVKTFSPRRQFENSDNGFAQLRAAGGFRLIRNDEIIRGIQAYEANVRSIMSLQEFNENILVNYRLKSARLMDAVTSTEMNDRQTISTGVLERFRRPERPRPFVSTDRQDMNELFNLAFSTANTNKYIKNRLLRLKEQALALDRVIVREYGSRFE